MLCGNCGIEFQGNFCSNCGALGNGDNTDEASEPIPRLKEPYFVEFGSQMFDANSIIRMYGFGIRKYGAYVFISQKTGLPVQIVKSQLDPIIQHHIDAKESTNIFDGARAQIKMGNSDAETGNPDAKIGNSDAKLEVNRQAKEKPLSKHQRIKKNKKNGVACCPKCGSVSLSANKKGFGFVKGAIGGGLGALVAPIGIVAGLGAGNIGGKRLWVTCLNCGKRWKM